jgi:hypothetical protein
MRASIFGALASLLLAAAPLACSRNDVLDLAMHAAPRPPGPASSVTGEARVGERMLLSGDLHCHVQPPDASHHVSRELPATIALAENEHLDFVVLSPHVPARFFADAAERAWVEETQRDLRDRLARAPHRTIVVPGFEYTDHRYGHVGAAFADVAQVMADLDASGVDLVAHPEAFFARWVARGGVLVVNHPVQRPMPAGPVMALRYDMSFRALLGVPAPPEMRWIAEHAQLYETWNASIAHLRDHLLLADGERSRREATHLLDVAARARGPSGRAVGAAGGSDSHGAWLRATTWVLAKERSGASVRDALVEGRTCVGGPEACTLQARRSGDGGASWAGIGDELDKTDAVDVRAGGSLATTFVVDGERVATAEPGQVVRLPIRRERCALLRAITGASWSSHVRIGCAR